MKFGAIFFFLLSCYNLIHLLSGNSFNGGKVIVETSTQSIVMQSILVIILGYLSLKLKWEV